VQENKRNVGLLCLFPEKRRNLFHSLLWLMRLTVSAIHRKPSSPPDGIPHQLAGEGDSPFYEIVRTRWLRVVEPMRFPAFSLFSRFPSGIPGGLFSARPLIFRSFFVQILFLQASSPFVSFLHRTALPRSSRRI